MSIISRNLLKVWMARTSLRVAIQPAIRTVPRGELIVVLYFPHAVKDSIRIMSNESKRDELKKRLTPLQWHVTQEKGTERPFTGCYNKFYDKGTYTCIVCDQELFSSETKYDSGCGWPAFNEVLDQGRIKLTKDTSGVGGNLLLLIANPDMVRTEVTCSSCGAHLGHVFNDGPKPTRKRFCINSASISFHEAGEEKKSST